MADKWRVWQEEFEGLTPFAGEWQEGRVEDFIRTLLNTAARKREQRDALLALMAELQNLHAANRELLAFFELERAQSWSAGHCGASDVDGVMAALAEWRTQVLKHGASFPPAEDKTRTMAAMQQYVQDAQAAAATIRPCFAVLDAALSPKAGESRPEPVDAVAAEAAVEQATSQPGEPE